MTTTRLVGTILGRGMALTSLTGLAVLGIIEAVERSRGQGVESLGLGVILRMPALARELWPVLLAAGAALAVARARSRGELVALGASGVSPMALRGRLVAVGLASSLVVAALAEGLTPWARDAALRREAAAGGHPMEVAGAWLRTERGLVRARQVSAEELVGVTILPHTGPYARIDVASLRSVGEGWVAQGAIARGLGGGGVTLEPVGDEALTASLPSPEALRLGTRRFTLEEASLVELVAHPDPSARAWARHRGLAPLGGGLFVGAAALFGLGVPWGAAGVSAAALSVGALWVALGLGAVALGGAGVLPLGLAAALLALTGARAPRWGG